jgi:molybdopterin converting factor small subunit
MKYKLSLNKDIVQENMAISNQDTVGIMPPFSGG